MVSKGIPFGFLLLAGCYGCIKEDKQLEIELRRSLKNFVASVNELHVEGLHISVFFPGVSDYKLHVQNLLFAYLEQLNSGVPITFDDQGVVLSRFMGMLHHNYQVDAIESISDSETRMRISFHLAYDANLRQANYEKGTTVYIPAKPFGNAHVLKIGEDIPAPRQQVRYLEVDILFRRTNHAGFWQIRSCQAVLNAIEFETSYETQFSRNH